MSLGHFGPGLDLGLGGARGGDRLGSLGCFGCRGGLFCFFHGGVSFLTSELFRSGGSSFQSLVGLLFRGGTSVPERSMRELASPPSPFPLRGSLFTGDLDRVHDVLRLTESLELLPSELLWCLGISVCSRSLSHTL